LTIKHTDFKDRAVAVKPFIANRESRPEFTINRHTKFSEIRRSIHVNPNTMDLEKIKAAFRRDYSYIEPQISDKKFKEFFERDYVKDESLPKQLDLFSDYLMANNLAEVQE
jgi:hypothetical protein